MLKFINNIKIRTKLFIFVASILALMIAISVVFLYSAYLNVQNDFQLIEQTTRSNYDINIKNQVDNVGSSIEGTNRYDFHDARGTPVLKQFIDIALEFGSGYQDYWFPKANQTEPLMKRGYVKLFKPFNWVVGTGNYIDDINQKIEDKRQDIDTAFHNQIWSISLLFLIVAFCTIFLVYLLSKSITKPLLKTADLANLISNGVLDQDIDHEIIIRKDEVGQLATSIEKMKNSIKELVARLTEKAKTLELEKELFSTTLKSIGDGVISTDQDGRIVLLNTVSEELTGWTQEEAAGKPFEDVFRIVNEYTREKCANPVAKALHLKEIVLNHTVLITKTGNNIPVEDSASPIIDKIGNIIGSVLVFRDVTEKKEKQKKIEYLSYHDQLTGLYNRHFFEEELNRIDVEKSLPLTIAMADVNGLKLTNDAFGHEAGDLLLQSIAKVLKSECRADDIVSRIGGDEFVLLLPRTNYNQAELIVKRIYKAISNRKDNNIVMSVSIGWETKIQSQENVKEVLSKAEDHMYSTKILESQSMRNQTIKVITQTLHNTNPREKLHSEKVSELSRKIGEAMNLDNEALKELEIAGLMHDIGKIAIDSSILNKPGKLTESEFMEIKKHPEIGYHILKSADAYTKLSEYVLAHHERWDGHGYPRGLSGQEIPLVSRIIAVADAYEAMTSHRLYKNAFSHEQAMEELKRCSGIQFDPKIVVAFEKVYSLINQDK